MRLLSVLLSVLLCCLPALPQESGESGFLFPVTWSIASVNENNLTCSALTCAQAISPATLTSEHILMALIAYPGNYTTNLTGISTGAGGTWTICCAVYNATIGLTIELAYNVNATTSVSSLTFTSASVPAAGIYSTLITEAKCVGCSAYGPIALDQVGTPANVGPGTCNPCAGPVFTTLAGQDFGWFEVYSTSPMLTITSPWVFDAVSNIAAYSFNTNTGNANTTLTSGSSVNWVATGYTFKP